MMDGQGQFQSKGRAMGRAKCYSAKSDTKNGITFLNSYRYVLYLKRETSRQRLRVKITELSEIRTELTSMTSVFDPLRF